MAVKLEQERIEWAPKDKEDEKFQNKIAEKVADKGPSRKEINQKLLEEEEAQMSKAAKQVHKNGWGKPK